MGPEEENEELMNAQEKYQNQEMQIMLMKDQVQLEKLQRMVSEINSKPIGEALKIMLSNEDKVEGMMMKDNMDNDNLKGQETKAQEELEDKGRDIMMRTELMWNKQTSPEKKNYLTRKERKDSDEDMQQDNNNNQQGLELAMYMESVKRKRYDQAQVQVEEIREITEDGENGTEKMKKLKNSVNYDMAKEASLIIPHKES
ncbi:hypothetical protein PIB30_060381 [Stylosanthes scabra]|uniref:Uncharacterized protein n=1 Tax=Stylosanthes scabra TaxID=79078 RepID=A0ABU6UJB4_9FABA|nr:hypothetical protein [Stylosanthes scabra]